MLKRDIFPHKIEQERSGLISWIDMSIENGLSDSFTCHILNLLTNFSVESEYFLVLVLKWYKVHVHLLIIVITVIATV